MITVHRATGLALLVLALGSTAAHAQFNLPIPSPPPASDLFRFDLRRIWIEHRAKGLVDTTATPRVDRRGQEIRRLALAYKDDTGSKDGRRFAAVRDSLCNEEKLDTTCQTALDAGWLARSINTNGVVSREERTRYVSGGWRFWRISRADVARYMRHSGGGEGLKLVPQFMANVSENEAYVVTNVVRGLVGSGIFSVDQAVLVTRSAEADTTKRKVIESDKANALRAINNGGTLAMHYAVPLWAVGAGTWTRVVGVTLGAGVAGSASGGDSTAKRVGTTTEAIEMANSFPIRDLIGTNSVVADLIVSARLGSTQMTAPLLANRKVRHVEFGQLLVGIRQSGTVAVSALVTFANQGLNKYVPRLGVNFAAMR